MGDKAWLVEIYKKVQSEVEKEYGEKLSIEFIKEICEFQFKVAADCLSNMMEISLPKFGRFIIKEISKIHYVETGIWKSRRNELKDAIETRKTLRRGVGRPKREGEKDS